jgi:rhamnulokinase
VIAGPAEATALGNVLIQAIGAGEISGLREAREVVRRSSSPETITPKPAADWDRAYEKFRRIAQA